MERTKSEELFGRDRPAHWGACRKRIRLSLNDLSRVKKKQKVSMRRTEQVGLQAKTGNPRQRAWRGGVGQVKWNESVRPA